jgi:hypothetical protein
MKRFGPAFGGLGKPGRQRLSASRFDGRHAGRHTPADGILLKPMREERMGGGGR